MAAGPGLGSLCACAPRSGAAGPPRHGGWRRGRARRDAGPARFRLLPAARGLLTPTSPAFVLFLFVFIPLRRQRGRPHPYARPRAEAAAMRWGVPAAKAQQPDTAATE